MRAKSTKLKIDLDALQAEVEAQERLQAETAPGKTLRSAKIDKAFKGEL